MRKTGISGIGVSSQSSNIGQRNCVPKLLTYFHGRAGNLWWLAHMQLSKMLTLKLCKLYFTAKHTLFTGWENCKLPPFSAVRIWSQDWKRFSSLVENLIKYDGLGQVNLFPKGRTASLYGTALYTVQRRGLFSNNKWLMTLWDTAQLAPTGNISSSAVLLLNSVYSIWWLQQPYFREEMTWLPCRQ